MATLLETNQREDGYPELEGVTLANIDLTDRVLFAKLRERDLQAAEARIKAAVQRMQDLGVIDSEGRRLSKEIPLDMREESNTDFGG